MPGRHSSKRVAKVPTGKGFQLVSLDDYYDLVKDQAKVNAYHADAAERKAPDPKRTAHVDAPPPATSDVASRLQNERRVTKFSRRPKPTVRMKPISDEEAMAHIRSGTYSPNSQKALRWLATMKALAVGYGKTSGGGALRAPNRDASIDLDLSIDDLARAMEAMGAPSGPAKPPGTYLPGVHNPKSPVRKPPGLKKPSVKTTPAPTLAASVRGNQAIEAALVGDVKYHQRITKGTSVANIDFNDLFKAELDVADETLVDCPHCEAPITKADLAKAHKGKGAVTHVSGPKRGKSGAHVREQNPEGGTMRGGDGRGVHTPSRGVPGAKKHDEPTGVQNSKGSRARKSERDDSSSGDADSGDTMSKSEHPKKIVTDAVAGAGGKKSFITIRGTEHVQWIDDGSDARLAKAILEGSLGGTPPTQPLDLNHDDTRLLI